MKKEAMQLPEKVEVKGIRVLTSKQIAEEYGTSTDVIKKNFTRNREHFVEGKHYIALAGDELKCFKQNQVTNSHLVANRTAHLYLWTEKGALLHAKSINTDKTWQVYDYLVDFYFRENEKEAAIPYKKEIVPVQVKVEPNEEKYAIPMMEDPVFIFKNLLALADEQGIVLKLKGITGYDSILKGRHIAVRKHQVFEKVVYEAAYELAHYFIHYNAGDIINSPLAKDYNEQAERAAFMIIRMLDIKAKQKY